MKILFLTSRVPYPLDKGDKLRAYYFLKELSKYNEIILYAINDSKLEANADDELKKICRKIYIFNVNKLNIIFNLLLNIFRKKPFQIAYFTHKKAQKEVNEVIDAEKPDIIFYQLVRMAEYGMHSTIPKFLDYMDALSVGIKKRIETENLINKALLSIEYNRLVNYENEVFKNFKKHSIITEQDKNLIPNSEREKIEIVSNGVDFNYFRIAEKKYEKKYDIIFSGNMGYPPNIVCAIYLVKKIMPLIWENIPHAKIVIVGTSPSREILDLHSKNVVVTGRVDDIRPYFYESKIYVAPLFINIGLQNKLLEAMSMGVPCITTTLANNALKAMPNKDLLIADSVSEFAEGIKKLLGNPQLANEISSSAYLFAKKNHNWTTIGEQLNKLLNESNG